MASWLIPNDPQNALDDKGYFTWYSNGNFKKPRLMLKNEIAWNVLVKSTKVTLLVSNSKRTFKKCGKQTSGLYLVVAFTDGTDDGHKYLYFK